MAHGREITRRGLGLLCGPTGISAAAAAAGDTKDSPRVLPYESAEPLSARNRIDELVFTRWKQLGIQPAKLCSDAVFLRRAWLDVTGTLPTARQAREFLDSKDPGKRAALADRLLDSEEHADYWAMKWSDLLRVKAEFPIDLWPNAAQAYYHWIRAAWRENRRYDQFASELLTESGSNFRFPAVNFYRAMQDRSPAGVAEAVALTFMGVRAEKWPAERLARMAAFFSQIGYKHTDEWKEEIVYFDSHKAAPGELVFPDGTPAQLQPGQDPRRAFAEWLAGGENPYFARNIANRAWYWLLGRGIVDPPDDLDGGRPCENAELLVWLQSELAASHYDLKHLLRLILSSSVYQLSPIPRGEAEVAVAHFAAYPLRRLEAEVLIDALCQITGTSETYTSSIPEPYSYLPDSQRAVSLPDGSISSSFLVLFGRPGRDTGLESERNNQISGAQRPYLLNSGQVQRRIRQGPKLAALLREAPNPRERANQLYLAILSRYPTDEEWEKVSAYAQAAATKQQAGFDLAWALINSSEFLYRH